MTVASKRKLTAKKYLYSKKLQTIQLRKFLVVYKVAGGL